MDGVKAWLVSQFDVAGKDVPDFEYTSRSIAHLHNVATLSQAKTQAATIVANDFRQKATEYRSQVCFGVFAIFREILDHVVSSSQVLAKVANLLNIRDTELSSFLVAMADLYEENSSRREEGEKHFSHLEDDIPPCEAQMEHWKTNLSIMESTVSTTVF
ncbi:hypothetical protein ACS0TY_031013 [Phlomoides rotata]